MKGYTDAVRAGAQVFEAMEGIDLYTDLNEISFYTWGQDDCYLPQGSTRATLLDGINPSGEKGSRATEARKAPHLRGGKKSL